MNKVSLHLNTKEYVWVDREVWLAFLPREGESLMVDGESFRITHVMHYAVPLDSAEAVALIRGDSLDRNWAEIMRPGNPLDTDPDK